MIVSAEQLAAIAAFNRGYGALLRDLQRASLQSSGRNAADRVLLALGRRGRASSRQLCEDIAMDPAQLSRLVWRLTDEGKIVSLPQAGDRRVGGLVLTHEGEQAFAMLEVAERAIAHSLIKHLDASEVRQLVAAMAMLDELLALSA